MTTVPQPESLTASYSAAYDPWNRMVKLVDDSSGQTLATYEYGGLGRRLVKEVDTNADGTLDETRHFYYVGWQIAEERLGSSSDPDRQYVWGLTYVDALVARDRDTNGHGTLDERLYAAQDGRFSVTALVDTSGSVVERLLYTAYGEVTYLTASFGARPTSSYD